MSWEVHWQQATCLPDVCSASEESFKPSKHWHAALHAGYFENYKLRVPKEPAQWEAKLGGSPFPDKRQRVSTQWAGASSGEVSVLTGGLWDMKASELLVQPQMYGKFMEYGHNGGPLFLSFFKPATGRRGIILTPAVCNEQVYNLLGRSSFS